MPTSKELIANGRTDEEIAREIGADQLIYQDLVALIDDCRSVNPKVRSFETSCFSGSYITGDVTPEYLAGIEANRNDAELTRRTSVAVTQLDLNLATTD
jgi:amidophosphoribosyltransferase